MPSRKTTPGLTIISGGQTGVDRAALDCAMALGMPCGGWCPKGRRAEDGTIPPKYPLRETPLPEYHQRTEWNVRDADGTLVLTDGEPSGGTRFTIESVRAAGKPFLVIDVRSDCEPEVFWDWIRQHRIATLNVAGPRESHAPGAIYRLANLTLRKLLRD